MTDLGYLRLKPLYMERVWGGSCLKTHLHRELPTGSPIGESWEIVDREEAQSVIINGPLKGLALREALESYAEDLMGPDWNPASRFPVLVKWLDCRERLSLQVHPPASVAPELGGEPKTENWYVAAADPGASLIVGLKTGVVREQFLQALQKESLKDCVHSFTSLKGDSLLVESGRLHAIDAGNLILEIQQNSDTTFRVYDWGRLGLDGQPRQLHVEESLRCIDFHDFEPEPLRITNPPAPFEVLADCNEFRIIRHVFNEEGSCQVFPAGEDTRLVHVVEGTLEEVGTGEFLEKGDNVILPYTLGFEFVAEANTTILVTDRFLGKNSPESKT